MLHVRWLGVVVGRGFLLKFAYYEVTESKIDECKRAMKRLDELPGGAEQTILVKQAQKELVLVNQQLSNAWHSIVHEMRNCYGV